MDVTLHPRLDMLLSVPQVNLASLETFGLVHHNLVATLASEWTHFLVSAIAREVLEVFRNNFTVELGAVQVTLKKLANVRETVV